jgi:lipid II:glycine glycyltransferase (peptidoglycan interpeptide bridge formation enzyme)
MIVYIYQGVCTYAFSVADPKFSKLSIGHALIWECLKLAKDSQLNTLDFEGSMIPEIERVFRRFGASPKPYMNVQYARYRLLYRS